MAFNYELYEKEYKERFGNEYGFNYVGSALQIKPDVKGYTANDLRRKMPQKDNPVKISHLKVIEQRCEKAMENAAEDGKYSCKYTVKELIPGLPPIDTKFVFHHLFQELRKREGIMCCADPDKENTLIISWAHYK
jgi:hypothetical protein